MRNRLVSKGSGTAQTIAPFSRLLAAERTLTAPDEGGCSRIPAARHGFQPLDELFGAGGVLAGQGTTHQNPLDGFGHIQPASTQGRVQRHNAVRHQPADERHALSSTLSD